MKERNGKILTTNQDRITIAILTIVYLIFVTVWSHLALYRLYHEYTSVFDLGIFTEFLWLSLHAHWTIINLLDAVFSGSIIQFIFSPLTFFKNVLVIVLIFQTFFIWAPVFPIYFIARKFSFNYLNSFLISVGYFFYPFVAGINWFDVHRMAFFPFFFLLAYTLYTYEKYKSSLALFIIADLTKFPFAFYTALFSLIELAMLSKTKAVTNKEILRRRYLIIIFIFSIISLILGFSFLHYINHASIYNYLHNSPKSYINWFGIDGTVFLIFAPFLFLPEISRKWLLFFLPFILTISITNYWAYFYPYILYSQYSSSFVIFSFLGFMDSLKLIKEKLNERSFLKSFVFVFIGVVLISVFMYKLYAFKYSFYYFLLLTLGSVIFLGLVNKKIKLDGLTQIIAIAFILLLGFSLIFQPWSPMDINSQMYYSISHSQSPIYNYKIYTYLVKEGSMIPLSDPYVLVSNLIPEAFPRNIFSWFNLTDPLILVSGLIINIKPVNMIDAINNKYPTVLTYLNGTQIIIPIDYAWGMTFDPCTATVKTTNNQTLLQIMQIMLQSGKYGVLAEANGTILLERNYNKTPAFYVPMTLTYTANQLYIFTNNARLSNNIIMASNESNKVLWYGPYTTIAPGTYKVTFYVKSIGITNSSKILFKVTTNYGTNVLGYITVNGSQIGQEWTPISFTFYANNIYTAVEFPGFSYNLNGTIMLKNVSLVQIGPWQPIN